MKAPILPALLTLALGCALAREAGAQASYQQQIRASLRAAGARVRGGQPEGEARMGVSNGGKNASESFDLRAGVHYAVVGVCDENCSDIDLRLFGPTAAKLAEDVQQNATPVLEFTAPAAGRYRLQIEMVACSANPCAWGAQLLVVR